MEVGTKPTPSVSPNILVTLMGVGTKSTRSVSLNILVTLMGVGTKQHVQYHLIF